MADAPKEAPDPAAWLSDLMKEGQVPIRETEPRPTRVVKQGFNWVLESPRRRKAFAYSIRVLLIVGMLGLATAAIYPELTNAGNPPVQDPLTQQATWTIPSGNVSGVVGLVTGDDMIEGNFTLLGPPNGTLVFYIVNAPGNESWTHLVAHPLYESAPLTHMWFNFTAPLTGNYGFLLYNPNPGVTEEVFLTTVYFSSLPPA